MKVQLKSYDSKFKIYFEKFNETLSRRFNTEKVRLDNISRAWPEISGHLNGMNSSAKMILTWRNLNEDVLNS